MKLIPHNSAFVFACVGLLLTLTTSTAWAQKPILVNIQSADVSSGGSLSEDPVFSANGRLVAFTSDAVNLSALPDTNGQSDVFVRDLQAGATTLVSVNLAGTATGNGSSRKPVISADGRFIAFESTASNLVANDTNSFSDIFVRDLQTGSTTMVSVNNAGVGNGNQDSLAAVISANGRVVIFKSFASNLIANDNNNSVDVFARDLQTGITSLVSCNATCTASGNGPSFPAAVPKDKAPRALISKDGRFVVFESNATDLVTLSDSNGSTDVFLRDLQSNTTSLVSVNRFGTGSGDVGGTQPVISGNGRFVFFQSSSTNLTANGAPFSFNLFARDLQTGVTTMVSVTTSNTASVGPSNFSYLPVASDDGRYVIFQSDAPNYVSNDTNNASDIFLRDLQTNTTTLISVNTSGVSGSNAAQASVMSADGRYVAFTGFGPDYTLTPDTNGVGDVYLRDVVAGTTTLLSFNSAGTKAASRGGGDPVISADGRFVAFESGSNDLVPNPLASTFSNVFAVACNGRVKFDAASVNVDEAAGTASVSVTRTGSASGALTVQYATSNGTATAAADYSAVSGSITFADGETSKTIVVPIINDTLDEFDERLALTLSDFNASAGAAGSLDVTLLTITDDDPPPSVSIDDVTVNEGNSGTSFANFTASLSNVSGKPVSFTVSVTPGTASAGIDYGFSQTTVIISPGNVSQKIPVQIIGDTTFEDDETFFINLSNPTNVTIAGAQGMGTIKNDDPIPSVTINDVTLAEGNSGTRLFTFSIRLSNPSSRQVTVQFATADGTAQAGTDYVQAAGTLTFIPGATIGGVLITVNGDTLVEGNEIFFVNLSNPTNATLGDSQGVGTIVDDEIPVLVTEQNSESAVALDLVSLMRDPFSLTRSYSFGPDLHTRVLLFAMNLELLPGETASAVTASADDEFGNTYSLPVEYVAMVPAVSGLSEVVVRLPDNVGGAKELWVKITLRGETSNRAQIRIASP